MTGNFISELFKSDYGDGGCIFHFGIFCRYFGVYRIFLFVRLVKIFIIIFWDFKIINHPDL